MQTNHTLNFEVTPQDIDFTRHITVSAIGNYILNTAGIAATQNNFGWEKLMEENLCWVLSRFAIEMQCYPLQDECFSIETWVEDYNKMFTTRNFKIFDKNKNIIGAATSIWAIIDINTRKPYNLQSRIEWHRAATGIGAGIEKAAKINEIFSAAEPTAYHKVAYSDIDFNQHTNSMKYLQWLTDTVDLRQFEQKNILRFDANYMQEARFGDTVAIIKDETDEKIICEFRNEENKPLCRIRIIWNEK